MSKSYSCRFVTNTPVSPSHANDLFVSPEGDNFTFPVRSGIWSTAQSGFGGNWLSQTSCKSERVLPITFVLSKTQRSVGPRNREREQWQRDRKSGTMLVRMHVCQTKLDKLAEMNCRAG